MKLFNQNKMPFSARADRIAPKKSLGQNFLTDGNIARKIVDALDCKDGDTVVEIGPGTGVLTEYLAEMKINLFAVEIDQRAVEVLKTKYRNDAYPNLKIIHSDIRDFDFSSIVGGNKIKVIGNIPYYMSSEILFKLFNSSTQISKAIIMLQKEVAKRLNAKLRTKDYGILTVNLQFTGESKILFDVPPSCFYPQPKVTSSIIEINFDSEKFNNYCDLISRDGEPEDKIKVYLSFKEFIRAAFSQRRKVLRNSLKDYIAQKYNREISPDIREMDYFCKRAEELTIEDFLKLYNIISGKQCNDS